MTELQMDVLKFIVLTCPLTVLILAIAAVLNGKTIASLIGRVNHLTMRLDRMELQNKIPYAEPAQLIDLRSRNDETQTYTPNRPIPPSTVYRIKITTHDGTEYSGLFYRTGSSLHKGSVDSTESSKGSPDEGTQANSKCSD